jgi:recombinational DNA repair protein (RecF pathway)
VQDMDDQEVVGDRRDVMIRLILFQLALLGEIGLQPVLKTCVNCRRPLTAQWRESYFSSAANGLICRDCEMSFPDKVRLDIRAANILADLKQIAQADEKALDEIERVLIHHFTHILGRSPKLARHVLPA